jgi:heme/copper-type cytochrome/quinol oxidase subunit 2
MDHGFMPIVVRVVSRTEYEGWLTARRALQR